MASGLKVKMMKAKSTVVLWSTPAIRTPNAVVDYIDHFDARGMSLVYSRIEPQKRGPGLMINLWLTKSGQLLARFSSRSIDVDSVSLEVKGFASSLKILRAEKVDERWVPQKLRDEFNDWVLSEMQFPPL